MAEKVIQIAQFNPKVKQYWLLNWVVLATVTVVGIIAVPFILILGNLLAQRVLNAMSAELGERKLFVKRGIFVKVEKSIPLEKITDVGMAQGPLMRLFGLHALSFETAGQSSVGPLVAMIGIEEAAAFREAILTQKDKLNSNEPAVSQDQASEQALLEELTASVRRIESTLAKMALAQIKQKSE